VVVRDHGFADQLRGCIEAAIRNDSRPLRAAEYARRTWLVRVIDWIAYGATRVATNLLARSNY
jgi:hypothetical protein